MPRIGKKLCVEQISWARPARFFLLSQEFEPKCRIDGTCAAVLLDSEEPHEMLFAGKFLPNTL